MPRQLNRKQTPCQGWLAGVGGFLFLLTGCATYYAEPITSNSVQDALQPPAIKELRVQASEIRHPLLTPVAFDVQNGLSPDEAAIMAVLLNPALRVARDEAVVADAQLIQARLLPNPELDGSFETPVGGDTKGTVNAYGIGLHWNVISLIGRSARLEAAEADRAGVQLEIAWKEWQVAMAAKAVVYDLVYLDKEEALAFEQVRRCSDTQEKVRAAVGRGSRASDDLTQSENRYHRANTSLLELQAQQAEQRLILTRILGLPAGTNPTLRSEIELPRCITPPDMDVLLKDLEQRRLDLLALRRGYESQEATVRATILDQFPKIDIGPTLGRDTENVETAGLGLTITLPIFDRNQGRIAIERATRKRLFDEYVNRVFEVRADVEFLRTRLIGLNSKLAEAEKNRNDLQMRADQLQHALADGRTDILTYAAADTALAEAQMNIFTLQREQVQSLIALELATGIYRIPINEGAPTASNPDEATP